VPKFICIKTYIPNQQPYELILKEIEGERI